MDEIEVGDIVVVNFHNVMSTLTKRAEVLRVPHATGDSWRFKDTDKGVIHYVSEGCTITLLEKRKGAC